MSLPKPPTLQDLLKRSLTALLLKQKDYMVAE